MKFAYDLHIHSALSPCGDNLMTPFNIVKMSMLKGLDIIAVTDHQSCGNVQAAQEAAVGTGIIVMPGLEVECREEVHLLCLFAQLNDAKQLEKLVHEAMPQIENKREIFGEQLYMDKDDNVIGEQSRLLLTACNLPLETVHKITTDLNGVCIPAHIDRDSFSILSNLGMFPVTPKFNTVEVSPKGQPNPDYFTIQNSDAHYLGDISERINFINLEQLSKTEIINLLKNGTTPT